MSLPFLLPRIASKIADWAIIPNFKSFQIHFSLVLKFIQHNNHHCKAHHSVALSVFVVSSCCHPWQGLEHFYLPKKSDHALQTVVSLFLTETTPDDSSVTLLSLSYYLALDLLGSSCIVGRAVSPSSTDSFYWRVVLKNITRVFCLNVMSLHVDLFKLSLEICVCLSLKIMRCTCTQMDRHLMVSVQGTGTGMPLSSKMWVLKSIV